MCDLETLEAITSFSFFSDNIEYRVDEFSTFSIVTFSPVITGTSLSEYKVVWSEELSEWSGSYGIHSSWFEIHKNGSWDKSTTCGFIIVYINSF